MSPDHDAWLEALTLRERAKAQRFLADLVDRTWRDLVYRPRVCASRSDSPGFFESCGWNTKAGCVCSAQVVKDLKADPYAYATDEAIRSWESERVPCWRAAS